MKESKYKLWLRCANKSFSFSLLLFFFIPWFLWLWLYCPLPTGLSFACPGQVWFLLVFQVPNMIGKRCWLVIFLFKCSTMFIISFLERGACEPGVRVYVGIAVYHLGPVHHVAHKAFPIKWTGPKSAWTVAARLSWNFSLLSNIAVVPCDHTFHVRHAFVWNFYAVSVHYFW